MISFDGTEIYYRYFAGKYPLVLIFLHGVGGNWTVWKKEIEYFQQKGFSTLTLDLRGHGLSDAPEAFDKYQLDYFSHDLNQVMKEQRINNFILVGHSLGGAIALNYCMNYPKTLPKALIMVESASTYPFDHDRILNYGPYLTHFLRFISEHKHTRKEHFPHFSEVDLSEDSTIKWDLHLISYLLHLTPLRTIVNALDNVENFVFKNQSRIEGTLRSLEIPILIISGDHDHVVPAKYGREIKKIAPHSKFKLIKNADHMVIVKKAGMVSKAIYDFIYKAVFDFDVHDGKWLPKQKKDQKK